MKFKNILLAVKDINQSVEFYKNILNLKVISDFGDNKTLTGGISLQTIETWKNFIEADNVSFYHNSTELYFEEDNFDLFILKLKSKGYIRYVHSVKEHGWGQRVVRFYDLDGNIIEVGENLKSVVARFKEKGLTIEEISKKMDIPIKTLIKLSV